MAQNDEKREKNFRDQGSVHGIPGWQTDRKGSEPCIF